MPIATRCDEGRDLTLFTVTGELACEDQMAALRAFYRDTPSKNVLWDLRRLEDALRWIEGAR